MKEVNSNAVLSLRSEFYDQYISNQGGVRGKASYVAIHIPRVRHNPRDRQVSLANGDVRTIPYYILNQSRSDADMWIETHLGAKNAATVQSQLG